MNIRFAKILWVLFSVFVSLPTIFAGFVAGTKVLTPRGLVPIESIQVGSVVTGYNSADNSFPESAVRHIASTTSEKIYVITTDKGTLYTSNDQTFYDQTCNDFIQASNVSPNTIFVTKDLEPISCISIDFINQKTIFHDITLDEPHLFFSSDAQFITHNAGFVATGPWIAKAITELVGFCVGMVCLYNKQPTNQLIKIDQIEKQIHEDMNNFCLKHYSGIREIAPDFYAENYKSNTHNTYKQPTRGGVNLNPQRVEEMTMYPLRYGSFYPIAMMTGTGDVACVIFVPRFSYREKDGHGVFDLIQLGKDIFRRSNPFVKVFVEAEDKYQLDELKTVIKKWPSSVTSKLFKQNISLEEEAKRFAQQGCFDKEIYGKQFGVHAIASMVEKNIPPSLVLQCVKYGNTVQPKHPDRLICFDMRDNVTVVMNKATKKIINTGRYIGDFNALFNDTGEKQEEKNNDKKYPEKKEEKTNIEQLNDNDIRHISHDKHNWDKLVPDKKWDGIKKIIKDVMNAGKDEPYKGVRSRVKEINGRIVEVTYTEINGIKKISNAWVK